MKKYSLIYADPPWQYKDPNTNGDRGAACKYPTMSLLELTRLPVHRLADDAGCVLAMWWTGPLCHEALHLTEAWGFSLKTATAFCWHKRTSSGKSHFGLGHWTRGNTENVLLATRGKVARVNGSVRQFVDAPIGRHSEKPAEVRNRLVQLLGDVPRIELFARATAPGWDAWGNEVDCGDPFAENNLSGQTSLFVEQPLFML